MKNQTESKFEIVTQCSYLKTLAHSIVITSQKSISGVLRIPGTSPDDEVIASGEFHHRAFMKEKRYQRD